MCVVYIFSVNLRQWEMKVEIVLESRNDISDQNIFRKLSCFLQEGKKKIDLSFLAANLKRATKQA